MVLTAFEFQNLIGTVYGQGNLVFTSDGNTLLSPVGNRVATFDLIHNKSKTLSFQNAKNIRRIALSPNGKVLISVDQDGRALLVNLRRSVVLHHFNFHAPARDVQFSPDGKYIAVTHHHQTHVWNTPSHLAREFAPFVRHRIYTGHYDDVLSITWSADSKFFLTTSKDFTARLYTLDPVEGYRPKTFAGHKDAVLAAYFSKDEKSIYTVSRDGALFTWRAKHDAEDSDDDEKPMALDQDDNAIANTRWGVSERHFFNQGKVTSVSFHQSSSMLVVGFANGLFGIWSLPAFNQIHTLSISQENISSVAFNPSGEWLAFGASKLGQLLVWEWQSENYILKQQGHYFDMNCLAFSPEDGGQHIVTGGDDGKVKLWNASSGFCFVTFSEHASAISAVEFAKHGQVVFSASLDGTVRAFDMIRYRNFRTFNPPEPVQFHCLAVDPSGEIVCAAGSGTSAAGFEIFVWSTQTGKLIDTLTGHEGPVSSLAFSPNGERLASCSWDGSLRTWELYGRRGGATEAMALGADGLAVAWRPDGKEVAATNLKGQILFFDPIEAKQTGLIDGRRDISGGRKIDDRRTAANSESGKTFTSLAYTADGSCVIAGGNSKHVCLYDIQESVLLCRWEISKNLALDGIPEFLDSRKVTESGVVMDLVDDTADASDVEVTGKQATLPGVKSGDMSKRKTRPQARTKCVRIAPGGRSWAAASTEGLLIYSLDSDLAQVFDPTDLDIDITPETIEETVMAREYLKALIMAFRLAEEWNIRRVYESVPLADIPLVARKLPSIYAETALRFVASEMERGSRHVEFNLRWIDALLSAHGKLLRQSQGGQASATLRSLQKGLSDIKSHVSRTCDVNTYSLRYLLDRAKPTTTT